MRRDPPRRRRAAADSARNAEISSSSIWSVARSRNSSLLFVILVDRPAVGAAQLHRMRDDAGEHRFQIQCRTHRLADFAKRFQFSDGSDQLVGALLQFLQQPHILDRDDSLVGEGFKQLDLRRGEGAHLDPTRSKRSNKFSLQTKGRGQVGAPRSLAQHPKELGNRFAPVRRERGACHARASSDAVAHQC